MKPKRTFTSEFKCQVIEELLSGIATRAQISRKYNLSGGLITHWKEQYEKGKFGNEPTRHKSNLDSRYNLHPDIVWLCVFGSYS